MAVLQAKSVHHLQMVFAGQITKVSKRAHADVGRVVPLVGQALGHGHAALQHAQAVEPVPKIGEGHDAYAAHTHRFAQHGFGIAQVLQRVDLQHHIKRLVGKQAQAFVQVQLQHIDAALHTGVHIGIAELHAIAGAAIVLLQMGQQSTVAAAQVEHAGAMRHQAGNGLHDQGIAHAAPPWFRALAMLSK